MQTNITKYLAQCQLRRDGHSEVEESVKCVDSSAPAKPIASVHPVLKQEPGGGTPTTPPCTQTSNTQSGGKLSHTKEEHALPNGLVSSALIGSDTSVTVSKVNGPVSLLNHAISLPNGELDALKTGEASSRVKLDSPTSGIATTAAKTLNSNTPQNVVRFTVPCSSTAASSSSNNSPKNIVISAINKGTVVTSKVVTVPTTRLLNNSNTTAKTIVSSNQTSILTPRTLGNGVNTIKVSGTAAGKPAVGAANLPGTTTSKVISVPSSNQGQLCLVICKCLKRICIIVNSIQ